ncbi:M15 family metallopeptidase [Humidesulfovibrio sp.]
MRVAPKPQRAKVLLGLWSAWRAMVLAPALFVALSLQATGAIAADASDAALKQAGLVEPTQLDSSLVLDIRYATPNNFAGRQVYPSPRCYLRDDIAHRLLAVQKHLRSHGLGLKVYDCYRPFSVQEEFWRIMPDQRYVMQPTRDENGRMVKSSRHNRGAAVDVTLVDKDGIELAMPTGYDDFTEKAHRGSPLASSQAQKNSAILEKAMVAQGFEPLATEWWHFDGPGWQDYPPLDLPLPLLK